MSDEEMKAKLYAAEAAHAAAWYARRAAADAVEAAAYDAWVAAAEIGRAHV